MEVGKIDGMDTQEGAEALGAPQISVKMVRWLKDEGVKWNAGRLAQWWRWMGASRCSCGVVSPHCCPFTVVIGEADYGLHPWLQWAAFKENGLLTQTVHEHCSSGHGQVAHGLLGHCKGCHCKVEHGAVEDVKDGHDKVKNVKVDHPQVGHCKAGHGTGALVEDQSADSPNSMLMSPGATSKTRKRKERRRKLAAAGGAGDVSTC